ncbi:MAG TPA: hypothetical protein VMM79_12280 [Longimicrobiales bacterium]|nr:hypothetical protein [Longimicrobiales bacterium]
MSPKTRNILIVIVTLVVAFGIGAAWQFTQANRARTELANTSAELDGVRYELTLERLHSTLALATVAAQLGNYEAARSMASDFYTGLQQNTGDAPEAARATFDELLRDRDATITSLSRAQPEAGLELARLLGRYRAALGRDMGGLTPVGTGTPPDTMN